MENTIKAEVEMQERIIAPMASSPFANLEESRIRNACKRDRDFQNHISRLHNCARTIIRRFYLGDLTKEETISMLAMYCNRTREAAILNIQNSRYARYTVEELQHIF